MTDLKTAAARAADWLEANPTKHIARALARNSQGQQVSPVSAEADCFCALGRLAKELDLAMDGSHDYLAIERVMDANDDDAPLPLDDEIVYPAHPENGINALRNLIS